MLQVYQTEAGTSIKAIPQVYKREYIIIMISAFPNYYHASGLNICILTVHYSSVDSFLIKEGLAT